MSIDQPRWQRADIELYDELFYHKPDRELTEKEERFIKTMYIMEEFACGLDGI